MKMTIKEFFESKKRLAIKITTEEDLKKLCNAFDKEGIIYSKRNKYIEVISCFNECIKENGNVCLSNYVYFGSYGYSRVDWYIEEGYTILTINDIDFEEQMTVAEYLDGKYEKNCSIELCVKCFEVKNGKMCKWSEIGCGDCEFSKAANVSNYLTSTYIPKQEIVLTEFEKQLILNLDEEYKYIAKDSKGTLFVYATKPTKINNGVWANIDACQYTKIPVPNIFSFIKWEDEEPTSIDKLKEIARNVSI